MPAYKATAFSTRRPPSHSSPLSLSEFGRWSAEAIIIVPKSIWYRPPSLSLIGTLFRRKMWAKLLRRKIWAMSLSQNTCTLARAHARRKKYKLQASFLVPYRNITSKKNVGNITSKKNMGNVPKPEYVHTCARARTHARTHAHTQSTHTQPNN